MRVVRDKKTLADNFQRAQSEALQSFGDGTVFLERFLDKPRHIEVQLLGDADVNLQNCFILFIPIWTGKCCSRV